MRSVHNFQIEKFSLRVLLSICLIFCQFQPGVAYKSVAYKNMYIHASLYKTYLDKLDKLISCCKKKD